MKHVRTPFLVAVAVSTVVGAAIAAEKVLAPSKRDDPMLGVLSDAGDAEALRVFRDRAIAEAAQGDAQVKALLRDNIERNLRDKAAMNWNGQRFRLSSNELRRTVIEYEVWKYKTYVSSGVFPKRYFGYFDEKWDTAARERELREATHLAVDTVNTWQTKQGRATKITDAEVAVTIVAEGAAILLRERQSDLDSIHPVAGIGLDDIATGFARSPSLVKALDASMGTQLEKVISWREGEPSLERYLTLKEGIAATALMWLYEKELAAAKLKARDDTDLMSLPLEDQFIYGSLVYNSGLLFSAERVKQVKTFDTGDYLFGVSDQNAGRRNRLPVSPPSRAKSELLSERDYPDQLTSWSAVYHVLQRWGGYAGLMKFTDSFDSKGMFVAR